MKIRLASFALGTMVMMAISGCAASPSRPLSDTTDAILLVPVEQVRATAVQMLIDQGYPAENINNDPQIISTGYRDENDSIWDWLLHVRFGVTRSRVDISLIPEGDHATLVSIYVTAHGKDSLFSGWRSYQAPLPQSAANQMRLLKNALGLL